MQTRLRYAAVAAASACTLLAACRSSAVPNQVFTKPAPPSVVAPVPRTNTSWAFHPSTPRQNFVIDQTAVVAIRLDTDTRTDTISTHAEITFATTAGATSGTVSAYAVRNAGRAATTPQGLALPFPFRAEYSANGQQLGFTAPRDAAPCASLALAAAQSLRDLWFSAPDTLRVGAAWSDSSSYVVCRDGIPLRATARRAFRVAGSSERDGKVILTISRISRSTLDGAGAQFGESVGVTGAGSGSLDYELDTARGEIVSAKGAATLDLTLRGRARAQAVHQAVEIRISRN